MTIGDQDDGIPVTTTDLPLARGSGEALHPACQGEPAFHYSEQANLLRVVRERQALAIPLPARKAAPVRQAGNTFSGGMIRNQGRWRRHIL